MTNRDDLLAMRSDADVQELVRKGVVVSRGVGAEIKTMVLGAMSAKNIKRIRPVIVSTLKPLLVDAMIAAHLSAMQREYAQAPRPIELSIFSKVIDLVKKKLNMNLDKIQKEYDTRALKVLNDVSDKVERSLQKTVSGLIQEGAHIKEAVETLGHKFNSLGLSPKSDFQLETIFRTQAQTAYSAGRWMADQDPDIQEILWGYKYVTVGDDRVRETHEAMDGTTLPKNDPFWVENFPPNGWNCRCQAISIFEERRVVRAPAELDDGTPVKADKGFQFNPGDVFEDDMALGFDDRVAYVKIDEGIYMKVGTKRLLQLLSTNTGLQLSDAQEVLVDGELSLEMSQLLTFNGVPVREVEPDFGSLVLSFNPDQPRDENGRFLAVGGTGTYNGAKVKVLKINNKGKAVIQNPDGTKSWVQPHKLKMDNPEKQAVKPEPKPEPKSEPKQVAKPTAPPAPKSEPKPTADSNPFKSGAKVKYGGQEVEVVKVANSGKVIIKNPDGTKSWVSPAKLAMGKPASPMPLKDVTAGSVNEVVGKLNDTVGPTIPHSVQHQIAQLNKGNTSKVINVPMSLPNDQAKALSAAFPGTTLNYMTPTVEAMHVTVDLKAAAESPSGLGEAQANLALKLKAGIMSEADWQAKEKLDKLSQPAKPVDKHTKQIEAVKFQITNSIPSEDIPESLAAKIGELNKTKADSDMTKGTWNVPDTITGDQLDMLETYFPETKFHEVKTEDSKPYVKPKKVDDDLEDLPSIGKLSKPDPEVYDKLDSMLNNIVDTSVVPSNVLGEIAKLNGVDTNAGVDMFNGTWKVPSDIKPAYLKELKDTFFNAKFEMLDSEAKAKVDSLWSSGAYKENHSWKTDAYVKDHYSWQDKLSGSQRAAIEYFTTSNGCNAIRGAENKAEWANKDHKEKARLMNIALDKAPKAVGATVYRGMSLRHTDTTYQSLSTLGSEFVLNASSSSSLSVKVAERFATKNGTNKDIRHVLVRVQNNKTGVHIEELSEYKSEREVILRKGAKYKVVGHTKKEGKNGMGKPVTFEIVDVEEVE